MKKYILSFLKRGLMASVGGPVILAIVFKCLNAAGVVETLTVNEVVLGIVTSALLAFIQGGITVLYNIEKLPVVWATLIHLFTLYADYIIIYRVNGWIDVSHILLFTAIFFAGYAVVWVIVFAAIKAKVRKMNSNLNS